MIDRLTALFSVLRALWPMSLTAAFAALVVILLRLALRKRAPRQTVCLMWLIVFARLLFPFNLESHVSVMPAALAEPPAAVTQAPENLPAAVTFPVQEQTPAQAVQPGLVHTAVQEPAAVTPPVIQAPADHAPSVPDSTPSDDFNADSIPAAFPWQALLAGVWLAGVLAMLGYALISYLRLRRSVFAAVRAADGAWEHPHVYSPFILGFFRPKIYLPAGVTGPARQLILCHERAHLRRRDYIVKPICWLALALHWFNPLVWASYLLMSRDIEVACDQAVIRQLGPGVKADYSSALLALATNGRFPAPCPLAFGLGGVGSRIRNILSYRKPAAWIGVMSALAAILAAVCLLTDPIAQASSPPEDPDVPWHTLAVSPVGQPENGVYTQFTLTYGNQEHTFSGAHCQDLEIGSYVEDLNGDGAPELIVSLTSGYGDGFLTSNLHIFDSETFEEYNCADLVTLIDSSLTYSADSEAYYLSAPNFEQTVRKDSFPEYIAQEDLLYFISIGDYYSFSAADGVLYCTLGCKVTSSVSCGNLTVGLALTGDGFQCVSYSFAPAKTPPTVLATAEKADHSAGSETVSLSLSGRIPMLNWNGTDTELTEPIAADNLTGLYYQDLDGDGDAEVVVTYTEKAWGKVNQIITVYERSGNRLIPYTYNTTEVLWHFLGSIIEAYQADSQTVIFNHYDGNAMVEGGGHLDISYFDGYEDLIDQTYRGYTNELSSLTFNGSAFQIVLEPVLSNDSDVYREHDLSIRPSLYAEGRPVARLEYALTYTGSGFELGEPSIELYSYGADTSNPIAFSAYQAALEGEAFIGGGGDLTIGRQYTIDQVFADQGSSGLTPTQFTGADLDQDGVPEAVLLYPIGNGYTYLILRYHDGGVYGYAINGRGFQSLKTDGTFSFSYSAADTGCGSLHFTDSGYTYDVRASGDASGDPPLYKINGFSVTQSEFESYQQWQDAKKDVTWYDFTASNIQTLCS